MSGKTHTIAYITAGAGGMYCGSCMHDNTLARALTQLGVDVQLIPTYTPIRTDEEDVSIGRVFFGGINIFLEQKVPLYRSLPAFVGRPLDQPWLIRWATSGTSSASAASLGELTVSMLQGSAGFQHKEVDQLCSWLADSVRPQLVVFTNMLIAGCAPRIKAELGIPILVTLQGDDIFLNHLPDQYRSQALEEIRRLVEHVDGFLVHSQYYADFMEQYLGIPPDKFCRAPLGIDTQGFPTELTDASSRPPTIGYLARLSPEKGLHVLADAFLLLRQRAETQNARLHIAGWLGEDHREYAEGVFEKLKQAGLADAFRYFGVVDRNEKIEFLKGLDVLSVPTTYREPKGLFVLEALAAGVPVVQPKHGAFPELIASLGGGRLVPPEDPASLAEQLHGLLCDADTRRQLAGDGQQAVHAGCNAEAMAKDTLQVFEQFLND